MGTLRDVLNDLTPLGTAGDTLVVNGTEDGVEWAAGGGGGAPTGADYLVKTATGGLSAERVVTDGTSITFDWSGAGLVVAKRAALTGDVTASADSNATTVAKITETSGPTALTIGTIADGEFLKRVGSTLVSAAAGGSGLTHPQIMTRATLGPF